MFGVIIALFAYCNFRPPTRLLAEGIQSDSYHGSQRCPADSEVGNIATETQKKMDRQTILNRPSYYYCKMWKWRWD